MADLNELLAAIEARGKKVHARQSDMARLIQAITESQADMPRLCAALRKAIEGMYYAGQYDPNETLCEIAAILEGRE